MLTVDSKFDSKTPKSFWGKIDWSQYGKGLDNEKRRSVVSLMGLVMDLGLRRNDQGFSGRVWSAFSVSFLAGILVIYAEQ